ncbi:C2H2 transcriptional regulator [Trichoderma parareesei]|uniref:C2H2 transcriptional regulator n=1 Tax=Trichoderma parareesei TaxID=858221 RepID=A0A2H2Z8V7_TRIPA|nr:C2H2 transcriptional regulator [Trichoderma parareesei]
MASSSSIAGGATTPDKSSISGHVRTAGEIASHALARSFEALRGLALGGGSSSSSSSSIGNGIGVHAGADLDAEEYRNRNARGIAIGNSLDSRAIHNGLHLQKRHLAGGAIAGITVGVIVAVALLAICLYPCFLYLKRRRSGQSHPALDAEAGIAPHAGHGSSASGGANTPPKRLSSSDSYRHRGELTRGGDGDGGSADYGHWEASIDGGVNNGYSYPLSAAYLQPGDPGLVDSNIAEEHRVKAQPFPLLGCEDGEFAPPIADDHQPGVLKGTSADYYSPHIPSEAFGMVTQPDAALDSPVQPPSSRSSSLRQNMMQIFRRKTGRDATIDSTISRTTIPEGAAASHLDGATPLQTLITTGDRVDSPTNISAASLPLSRSPSHHHPNAESAPGATLAPVSPPASNAPEPSSKATPPESPPFPAYHQFRKSPSPPIAAPGTVNPMDIMPASTETEVWHRTEHQLYEAFHKASSSDPVAFPAQESSAMPSPSPTPPESQPQPQPIFTIQSPGATSHTGLTPDYIINSKNTDTNTNTNTSHNNQAHSHHDNGDVAMLEAPPPPNHDHSLAAPDGRHPSYTSDHSTPLPGPSFTDVSSQNTPSTQLDTPSPESMGSSDFRHSASPHSGAGSHSPRTGVYRCDEPGCNQAFDQPHKLKHHQRYHSKDHKCPYAGCGKGFGTKTHLQRHINDRHEKKKKFHCSVVGCDYSRAGGKAFPRKDNWKRHMIKIHNIEQQQLPEPIEVDMDLDGV